MRIGIRRVLMTQSAGQLQGQCYEISPLKVEISDERQFYRDLTMTWIDNWSGDDASVGITSHACQDPSTEHDFNTICIIS